jgi:hypothetical protein
LTALEVGYLQLGAPKSFNSTETTFLEPDMLCLEVQGATIFRDTSRCTGLVVDAEHVEQLAATSSRGVTVQFANPNCHETLLYAEIV